MPAQADPEAAPEVLRKQLRQNEPKPGIFQKAQDYCVDHPEAQNQRGRKGPAQITG